METLKRQRPYVTRTTKKAISGYACQAKHMMMSPQSWHLHRTYTDDIPSPLLYPIHLAPLAPPATLPPHYVTCMLPHPFSTAPATASAATPLHPPTPLTALPATSTGLRHIDALTLLRLRTIHYPSLDVCRETEERLLHIDIRLRADLQEGDAQLVRERLALLRRHHALVLPVALVADEDLVHALGGVLLDVGEPGADICHIMLALNLLLPARKIPLDSEQCTRGPGWTCRTSRGYKVTTYC